jgi:hypothetical protein
LPKLPAIGTKKKHLEDLTEGQRKLPEKVVVENEPNKEIMEISGVPEEHREVCPTNFKIIEMKVI